MKIANSGNNHMVSYTSINKKNSTENNKNSFAIQAEKTKEKNQNKKLNYNHAQLSNSVRRSKKSASASTALSKIRAVLGSLKKELGSGKYNETELKLAIEHAEKMVECALNKVNHLRMEESLENRTEQQQHGEQIKADMVRQKQENEKKRLEVELTALEREKELEQNMENVSKGNREKEDKDLSDADMEYVKKKMDILAAQMAGGSVQSGTTSGASADMGMAMVVAADANAELTASTETELSTEKAATINIMV